MAFGKLLALSSQGSTNTDISYKSIVNYAIYNLFFHPLARYEGPYLWSAFRFPFVRSMIGGSLPHQVRKMHKEYGAVVRVAPNELSFTDPAAWKDIHTSGFLRPYEYKDKPPGKDAENLISADESTHQRFRKILSPAFVVRPEQEAVIKNYVDMLVHKLSSVIENNGSAGSAELDVLQWLNYTTFDIIGDLLWGSSFDCLQEVRYHPWIQVIAQFKTALLVGATKFYYPLDRILMMATPKSAMKELMQIWKTTEEKIAQRTNEGSRRTDMISHMFDTDGLSSSPSGSGPKLSLPETEINAMMIVVGGSESVTTVLTGIFNCLLTDQTKLQELSQEVRTSSKSENEINGASLSRLPYLNAVLHEGLRLCPTIPDGMRREVPTGGAMVAGRLLPEKTVVSVPQWSTYQSADNFASPKTFSPERWLQHVSDRSFEHDRKEAFQPFSLGTHNCPGRSLAYLEMRLILARLLWSFDWQRAPGHEFPRWEAQKIYWFWEKQATHVKISPRKQ